MRLPSLGSLRAFEAASRLKSMAAAADALHVTHGAVSKQVQLLERELGVTLFERRNRGIHPTRAGRWLADRLGGVFDDLHRTFEEFGRREATSGPPTVSCEPTLCLRMLIPALGDLKAETGFGIRVLAAGGAIAFGRDHVDLAIRRADVALTPDVMATVLAPEWMGPVMVPSLATDWDELPRIHSATRPNAWANWLGDTEPPFGGPNLRFEHFYLALQAAEAGQGIAMASLHMVADALVSGRLCAPAGFSPDGTQYLAICPADGSIPDERLTPLLGWLARRMLGHEHLLRTTP